VAVTAPVPRPPHRFWRCDSRWMTISRHPEPCAGPLPPFAVRPTRDSSFRSTRLPTVSPADVRPELGPRSLDPDRSFWSALAERIWDQTSPANFCNAIFDVRATKPELSRSSRGGRPRPPSFSDVPRHLPCGSGDTRRAVRRPFAKAPVKVPPTSVGFPNRDADSNAPPPRLTPAVHSEDQRARVEGPSEGRVP
jgi:hypothetical protein